MRAWLEINMDNLLFNLKKVEKKVPAAEVMAVVKADAYSMGSIKISKFFADNGIKMFAVACLDEAMELRNAGIKEGILILGILLDEEIKQATQNDVQITVGNWEQIKYIHKNRLNTGVHIKIDTGMGRLGFTPDEGIKAVEWCLENGVNVMGIYSHLSDADGFTEAGDRYTLNQISKFEVFAKYKDRVKYLHILNSGGIIRFSQRFTGNLVRPGICLYGMLGAQRVEGFKRVFTVKTRVLAKRTANEDLTISYGRKGIIRAGETYVTIGMGYADGIKKNFSGNSYVIIAGEKCPIIGEICMDMCMVKIPDTITEKVSLGDEVIVLRDDIIEDMTIDHKSACDLLTEIRKRVHKVYIKDGHPY